MSTTNSLLLWSTKKKKITSFLALALSLLASNPSFAMGIFGSRRENISTAQTATIPLDSIKALIGSPSPAPKTPILGFSMPSTAGALMGGLVTPQNLPKAPMGYMTERGIFRPPPPAAGVVNREAMKSAAAALGAIRSDLKVAPGATLSGMTAVLQGATEMGTCPRSLASEFNKVALQAGTILDTAANVSDAYTTFEVAKNGGTVARDVARQFKNAIAEGGFSTLAKTVLENPRTAIGAAVVGAVVVGGKAAVKKAGQMISHANDLNTAVGVVAPEHRQDGSLAQGAALFSVSRNAVKLRSPTQPGNMTTDQVKRVGVGVDAYSAGQSALGSSSERQ